MTSLDTIVSVQSKAINTLDSIKFAMNDIDYQLDKMNCIIDNTMHIWGYDLGIEKGSFWMIVAAFITIIVTIGISNCSNRQYTRALKLSYMKKAYDVVERKGDRFSSQKILEIFRDFPNQIKSKDVFECWGYYVGMSKNLETNFHAYVRQLDFYNIPRVLKLKKHEALLISSINTRALDLNKLYQYSTIYLNILVSISMFFYEVSKALDENKKNEIKNRSDSVDDVLRIFLTGEHKECSITFKEFCNQYDNDYVKIKAHIGSYIRNFEKDINTVDIYLSMYVLKARFLIYNEKIYLEKNCIY